MISRTCQHSSFKRRQRSHLHFRRGKLFDEPRPLQFGEAHPAYESVGHTEISLPIPAKSRAKLPPEVW